MTKMKTTALPKLTQADTEALAEMPEKGWFDPGRPTGPGTAASGWRRRVCWNGG